MSSNSASSCDATSRRKPGETPPRLDSRRGLALTIDPERLERWAGGGLVTARGRVGHRVARRPEGTPTLRRSRGAPSGFVETDCRHASDSAVIRHADVARSVRGPGVCSDLARGHVDYAERLQEILVRYEPDSIVGRAMTRARPDISAAIERTSARLAALVLQP